MERDAKGWPLLRSAQEVAAGKDVKADPPPAEESEAKPTLRSVAWEKHDDPEWTL